MRQSCNKGFLLGFVFASRLLAAGLLLAQETQSNIADGTVNPGAGLLRRAVRGVTIKATSFRALLLTDRLGFDPARFFPPGFHFSEG